MTCHSCVSPLSFRRIASIIISLTSNHVATQSQTTRTKSEPTTPDVRTLKRKKVALQYDSSDDDKPLALSPPKASGSRKAGASGSVRLTNGTGKKGINGKAVLEGKRSEDDKPLVKGKGKGTTNGKEKQKPPRKRTKKSESVDDADIESEDDKPIVKEPLKRKRKTKGASDTIESSDDDKPLTKALSKKANGKKVAKKEASSEVLDTKKTVNKVKKEEGDDASRKNKKKKEEDDEEVFKWWEQQDVNGDGSIKWQTLEHNGVYFPPPYEPLPQGIHMKYAGVSSFSITPNFSC